MTPSKSEGRKKSLANNLFSCLKGGSGIAYQHLRPIKHKRLRPKYHFATSYTAHYSRHVIAIRPDAELGIILKPILDGREAKVVSVPRTGGVAGLGNSDTLVLLVVRAYGMGELADDPPISEPIIDDYRIAGPTIRAGAAKARPN